MLPSAVRNRLAELRRQVTTLDACKAFPSGEAGSLQLGLPALDNALQGGLALGAVHDLAPAAALQSGAATGFAFALAARLPADGKQVLWIQTDFAALENGAPYGPGVDGLGLPLHRLLIVRVSRALDVLWAAEEALKSPTIAAVLAELPADAADLTATRRLTLAARAGGGLGLLLRQRPSPAGERGHDAMGDRRRSQPARSLRRPRTHRFRPVAEQKPPRALRPLDRELESCRTHLRPAGAICPCG